MKLDSNPFTWSEAVCFRLSGKVTCKMWSKRKKGKKAINMVICRAGDIEQVLHHVNIWSIHGRGCEVKCKLLSGSHCADGRAIDCIIFQNMEKLS